MLCRFLNCLESNIDLYTLCNTRAIEDVFSGRVSELLVLYMASSTHNVWS